MLKYASVFVKSNPSFLGQHFRYQFLVSGMLLMKAASRQGLFFANKQVDGLKSQGGIMSLIENIRNPWIRLKVLKNDLGEKELRELTKEAFLFIVSTHNAFNFQKQRALDDIISLCPDAVASMSDQEMYESFQSLCTESARRGEIVSPAELDWVEKHVRDSGTRRDIEKLIYSNLLRASSHWDKLRNSPNFTLTEPEKNELTRQVLHGEEVGSVRKTELATELNEPKEEYVLSHYRKLLYGGHFDKAETLNVDNPQAVLEVVLWNIENHYLRRALEMLLRFLPEREELASEVRQMKAILEK